MDFRQQLRLNAENNFTRFKSELEASTTDEVFNNAYKICTYSLMSDFLDEADDFIPFEQMEFLISKNDTVIDFLWDRHSNTIYSANSDLNLTQMIDELYAENLGNQDESQTISYKEKLSQNAEAEYQEYIAKELQKSKTDIIQNAYEISVFSELHNFLTDKNSELEEYVCKNLCAEGENVLDVLFYEFSTTSQASINSYDDVYDFLHRFSDTYFKNGEINNRRRNELEGSVLIVKLKEFSDNFAAQQSDSWDKESVDKISMDIRNYFYIHESTPTEINDYLHARLAAAKASIQFLNDDLSYICGTDGLINYCCIEKELLSSFIKENPSKRGNTVFEKLNNSYVESIYSYAEGYGFTRQAIADTLDKKIAKLSASTEM